VETPIRPGSLHHEEARKTLASILNLLQKDRALGERALSLFAAFYGLPLEALRAHLLAPPPRSERAREAFQRPYLAHFAQTLPRYPYATDNPRQGMRPRRKEKALEHVYIQVGRYPHAIFRIVLDLDEPTWWDAMDRIPPTLTIPNSQAPWKAHIVYELEPPIWLSSPKAHEGQGNPFALVREVDALLRAYFGADPAYNGLLGRNPLAHPHLIGGGKLWDLPSLLEELRELTPRRRALAYLDTATYGRNCTLFDHVRVFAYGVVAMYRGKPNGFELFRQAVAYEAHRLNQELFRGHPQGPLPRREVEATIVKSVSKWTFYRYRGTRVWPVSGTGRPDRSRLSPAARALVEPLRGRKSWWPGGGASRRPTGGGGERRRRPFWKP